QLFAVAMIRSSVIALVAAAIAGVVAILVSPLFPMVAAAKLAEPSPGVSLDPYVVWGGLAFIVLAVLLISLFPAWKASRVRGDAMGIAQPDEARRPSVLAAAATRSGLPASAVAGVRMAVEPGRGRTAVPVRAAIIGLVVAV